KDPVLAKLLDTYLSAKPGSEERETARGLLELDEQHTKNIPTERHKLRMSALYVDAVPSGWNRPTTEVSATSANMYLRGAAKGYSEHLGADPELEQWITLSLPPNNQSCRPG